MTNEECKQIIAQINFEEKWLLNIKTDIGFISKADIRIAMNAIRVTVAKLKGEQNEEKTQTE